VIKLIVLALTLAWWPGGDRGFEPVYPHPQHIIVVDTVDGNDWYRDNLHEALHQWNDCGPVHLELGDADPFASGTITLFVDVDGKGQDGPYGGWNGTAGIIALAGGWTRSREVIAHEMGHALGFGHTNMDSIMGDGTGVQPIDCEGLRSYY